MFDSIEQKKAKQKAAEDAAKAKAKARPKKRSSAAASAPTAPKPKASRRMSDADRIKKAKSRLKADKYSSAWMKHIDKAVAQGIFDMSTISENYQKGKKSKAIAERDAKDQKDDRDFGQKEEDERQAEATKGAKNAVKAAGKVPKKGKNPFAGLSNAKQLAALKKHNEQTGNRLGVDFYGDAVLPDDQKGSGDCQHGMGGQDGEGKKRKAEDEPESLHRRTLRLGAVAAE